MNKLKTIKPEWVIGVIAAIATAVSTTVAYMNHTIIAYGDAESHLNIAKRVIDSLTPGFAQLGGIWLPLPHILLIPFVWSDFLWRTGLAGSIVSGACFIVASIFIYKLTMLITDHRGASFAASLVFMANPNVLYLSSTPMTELTLIVFFVLSSYYFVRYVKDREDVVALVLAAFYGCMASLSRYDGWGLVLMEAALLGLMLLPRGWKRLEGGIILFCTLAFFGIVLWLTWGAMILGDPLYFTHSQFSANSQQQNWLLAGELPTYHQPILSLEYYSYTTLMNVGTVIALLFILGLLLFIFERGRKNKIFVLGILAVPFIFNVATLFLGQSIIFIPGLTPGTYQWTLFNVRYGVMMVPCIAVVVGYLTFRARNVIARGAIMAAVAAQCAVFALGYLPVITYADGVSGLSSSVAKVPDAQYWLDAHYDKGLVLEDDYSRTISIARSPIPMQDVIYVGNKPYWDDSLKEPEKYATWIVMQKDDSVWTALYDDPVEQGRLFKYFNKVYTSDNIYIFKKIGT